MHVVHVRSDRADAPALLLTHGRPSSFADFSHLAGPLGRDFHLVIPSIPGVFPGDTTVRR
ncbi:epoxide hydrolase N-terminal domain-containing protein [Nonomuraea sp. NPDC004580]|uniref:epoxide hydrolase N-terminal domain-containing protein n=1 Tax=Nonomuraea sp. NPDC004580 TaxID=3154552 RepID=UPI0033B3A3D8